MRGASDVVLGCEDDSQSVRAGIVGMQNVVLLNGIFVMGGMSGGFIIAWVVFRVFIVKNAFRAVPSKV